MRIKVKKTKRLVITLSESEANELYNGLQNAQSFTEVGSHASNHLMWFTQQLADAIRFKEV